MNRSIIVILALVVGFGSGFFSGTLFQKGSDLHQHNTDVAEAQKEQKTMLADPNKVDTTSGKGF